MVPTGELRECAEGFDGGSAEQAGLVERSVQWSRLEGLLADAMAGTGRAALVTGPPGSGKTELLRSFAGHASALGRRTLKISCSRSEQSVPFGLVSRLLRQAELPGAVAGKVGKLLDRIEDPSNAAPDLGRARHFLCQVALELAGERGILIGVDDVQYADPESLEWLACLIRRLDPVRALVVLTETTTPRQRHSPLHDELLRHAHCHRIPVAALTLAGVAELARQHLDTRMARRFAAAAHALSGGNPLLVNALLDDHPGSGSALVQTGSHFRAALLSCLHRCAPSVLATARALAILGDPATRGGLARLIGAGTDVVAAAIEVLDAAGVLQDGWFRDPAAREAVLDDTPAAERTALHLAAGRLLLDHGVPAESIAPHLVAAATAAPWTVPVLAEAADQALAQERVETALEYLELAKEACADEAGRATIAARLARVEWRANPAAAARKLPAVTSALSDGHLTARDAAVLLRHQLWHGHADDAAKTLRQAHDAGLNRTGEVVPEVQAAELWLSCTYPSMVQGSASRAKREPGARDVTAEPWYRATWALARVLTGAADDRCATVAEGVLQGVRPSDSGSWGPEAAATALLALVYADRLDVAKSWCDRLLCESVRRTTPVSRALFLAIRAEIALRLGDLPVAFEQAQAALTELPAAAWGAAAGFPLGCLITAATRMGRHDDAARHLELRVPEAMFSGRHGLHYLHARGVHYLATGRHHAALADFLACGELMTSWGMDTPTLVRWRTSAAEAWLRQRGNRDEARRLVNDQLARLGPDGGRARGVALRLLAATSQAHRRLPLLAESVAILTECGDQFELAHALADLSRTHKALRDHRSAWTVARRAWQVAKACHAAELCDDLLPSSTKLEPAERRSKATGGIDSLTDAERRVAALAAVGLTNREIAAKLFLTPSTIEQHLTKVYRKLNVKYRTDLPADLHSDLARTG